LWDLYPDSLANTILWAIETAKKHPKDILKMQRNGMKTDFSWNHTAELYRKMYEDAHK
jgi:glycogen synthase